MGCETDEEKAKQAAAKRWVFAVNNWGDLGQWFFHVCCDLQLLNQEEFRIFLPLVIHKEIQEYLRYTEMRE